ncbi:MAG: 30S ribosomal protein S6 [Minisyncoccia bacterium]
MEDTKTQVYEFSYLLMPTIPESEVSKKVTALKALFEKSGSTPVSEANPEFISLAYTMIKVINNKHERVNNAYFGWFKFEAPTSILEAVKMTLDRDDDLVRYLLIKTVKENTLAPKKVAPKRESRKNAPTDGSASGADPIVIDDEEMAISEDEAIIEDVVNENTETI